MVLLETQAGSQESTEASRILNETDCSNGANLKEKCFQPGCNSTYELFTLGFYSQIKAVKN